MMLLYKAWLESRLRFLCGLLCVVALSIFYVRLHPILLPGWIAALRDPHAIKPPWLPLGISEYRFYVWHFLFDYQLQNLWVVFAIIFGFGGLVRETAHGTALFSLSLPVSRTRWFTSRLTIAFLESIILALLPTIVIPLASAAIGQRYPLTQAFGHGVLMAVAGSIFVAIAVLASLLFRGEYAPLTGTLALVVLPYVFLQEWTRLHPYLWTSRFDAAHVMAGPWLLSWRNMPWSGVITTSLLTTIVLMLAIRRGRQLEF